MLLGRAKAPEQMEEAVQRRFPGERFVLFVLDSRDEVERSEAAVGYTVPAGCWCVLAFAHPLPVFELYREARPCFFSCLSARGTQRHVVPVLCKAEAEFGKVLDEASWRKARRASRPPACACWTFCSGE